MNAETWMIIRAIRGPIMLIVFGTLMALNHTDKIGFERTWPVLIITLGVLKLAERAVAPRVPPPPPYPGAGYPQYPNFPQGGGQ